MYPLLILSSLLLSLMSCLTLLPLLLPSSCIPSLTLPHSVSPCLTHSLPHAPQPHSLPCLFCSLCHSLTLPYSLPPSLPASLIPYSLPCLTYSLPHTLTPCFTQYSASLSPLYHPVSGWCEAHYTMTHWKLLSSSNSAVFANTVIPSGCHRTIILWQ